MNSLIWKRRLGQMFCSDLLEQRDVILIYHSVAGSSLSVSESRFRAQMGWLQDNAYVVLLDELLNTPNHEKLRVVLSFDDGYETLYDTVCPILTSHSFPAIVYLNSGMLGENKSLPSKPELGHYPNEHFLTWREASHLVKEGWIVGGHGVDHVDLTRISEDEIYRQLYKCKEQIEEKLCVSCMHFAYTWGHFDSKVRRAVSTAGFCSAVSGVHGPVKQTSDRFALPRIDIRSDYELSDFINVVTGRWDYLGLKHRLERILL